MGAAEVMPHRQVQRVEERRDPGAGRRPDARGDEPEPGHHGHGQHRVEHDHPPVEIDAQAVKGVERDVGEGRVRDQRPLAEGGGGGAERLRLRREVRAVTEKRAVLEGHAAQVLRPAHVDLDVVGIEAGNERRARRGRGCRRPPARTGRRARAAASPSMRPRASAGQEARGQGDGQETGERDHEGERREVGERRPAAATLVAAAARRATDGPGADRDARRRRRPGERRPGGRARPERRRRPLGRVGLDLRDPYHGLLHELVGDADHRQRPQGERRAQARTRRPRSVDGVTGPGPARDDDLARRLAADVERHRRPHAGHRAQREAQRSLARGHGQIDLRRRAGRRGSGTARSRPTTDRARPRPC